MTEHVLRVSDLETSFTRDKTEIKILRGVNFSIRKGEILGLVGESGSGKSLTSLSIMQLFHGTTGEIVNGSIHFNGEDLTKMSESEIRKIRGKQMAMIFQEPMTSLNPVLKIGKQLMEAIEMHLKLPKNESKHHAIQMLKSVGIGRAEEIIHEYPHQLSGGMRQRIMIAMAMACQPKLLIADEPTTALDVTIQAQILELMKKLKEEHETAILLITHDLGVVAEMCDKVVVMYAGQVVEEADVFELFASPKHPYTKGLIASVPKIGDKKEVLDSINGQVPSPQNMPKGCKFAPRCDHAMSICHQESPPTLKISATRQCSCWLYAKKDVEANV
ncbi:MULTISPECIES: ABC transporter ATP-binding protein [Lysinibacillus]|uniref:ABC transporter ATP-binding protein n=1 Tax=Lysinibacillus fusiformis TaxID=28031 RepID=A0A2I0V690_9BACI|nr:MULTISPECIES: ABC transporter ATP-binding protein [Lysinibacillus]KUF35969.1 peptide ABC transporter ATP-binding protein [Lysinibacillus sp. F5]MEE3807694.1 ABC transporter ATP-binding protein [Lysinibacillus fusiformis]PKU53788.1 ABC transporter ATP-binding protein [Lysinibacillus fusiformis]SCY50733.1 oligopeptide/dipeptide ABC transporter, ATP-binding protein, C-terminal domain-containing protein [Lysinibacillus sp. SG9]SDB22291.1 oligopeptide/dipeptide ABC transporter, ATP-binding prote